METNPNIPIAVVYSKALDLFKDRTRWARGYYQFGKDGNTCPWREGYSFCALGAALFFSEGFSHNSICCLQRVSEHLYGENIQHINDMEDADDAYKKSNVCPAIR